MARAILDWWTKPDLFEQVDLGGLGVQAFVSKTVPVENIKYLTPSQVKAFVADMAAKFLKNDQDHARNSTDGTYHEGLAYNDYCIKYRGRTDTLCVVSTPIGLPGFEADVCFAVGRDGGIRMLMARNFWHHKAPKLLGQTKNGLTYTAISSASDRA